MKKSVRIKYLSKIGKAIVNNKLKKGQSIKSFLMKKYHLQSWEVGFILGEKLLNNDDYIVDNKTLNWIFDEIIYYVTK